MQFSEWRFRAPVQVMVSFSLALFIAAILVATTAVSRNAQRFAAFGDRDQARVVTLVKTGDSSDATTRIITSGETTAWRELSAALLEQAREASVETKHPKEEALHSARTTMLLAPIVVVKAAAIALGALLVVNLNRAFAMVTRVAEQGAEGHRRPRATCRGRKEVGQLIGVLATMSGVAERQSTMSLWSLP
ncbi:MAG: hypothetical protein FAZ92_02197 [Accumulibacter sp.]|uniref:hypothetical protein n=1 Tax=Accumulibacter sp. TaxID=2053492 RepID=UPI0011F851E8|nr:hypothetical protein [Accumulibacter sp.]TLD45526.1 MAG: hypothetical protein FAZ92_02197 [Accumulibacter sp.]